MAIFEKINSRVFGLDLLRAVAILSVIYGHSYVFVKQYIKEDVYSVILIDGVTVFFVLSGFLIGRILIKTMNGPGWTFYGLIDFFLRRWIRTLPNYYLILTLTISYFLFLGHGVADNIFEYFLFLQNFNKPHPSFFPEAWSLAVEEIFYLSIPTIFFIFTIFSVKYRKLIIFCIIIFVILYVTFFRTFKAYDLGYTSIYYWDTMLRKQVVTRLDSIMYGVMGAFISLYKAHLWEKKSNMAFFIGFFIFSLNQVLFIFNQPFYINYLSLSVTSIATLLLLPKLSNLKRKSDYINKTVTFVSLISYSMYLVNFTLVQTIIFPLINNLYPGILCDGIKCYLLYWLTVIFLSFILHVFFERPINSLKDLVSIRKILPEKAYG